MRILHLDKRYIKHVRLLPRPVNIYYRHSQSLSVQRYIQFSAGDHYGRTSALLWKFLKSTRGKLSTCCSSGLPGMLRTPKLFCVPQWFLCKEVQTQTQSISCFARSHCSFKSILGQSFDSNSVLDLNDPPARIQLNTH